MLASENNYMEEASNTIFQLSAEEQIRKRCLDREEYYREIRTYKKIIAEKDAALMEKDSSLLKKDTIIQKLSAELEKLKANIDK